MVQPALMLSARTGKNIDWLQHLSPRLRLSLLREMMQNFTRQSGLHSSRMRLSTTICPPFKSRERCVSSSSTATMTYSLTNGAHPWPQDAILLPGFARAATLTSKRKKLARICLRTARTTISCWRSMDLTTILSRQSSAMLEVSLSNEESDSSPSFKTVYFNERHILSVALFDLKKWPIFSSRK